MSTPFCLYVPLRHYLAMLDQAVAELPNECCGLLAGRLLEAEGLGPPVGQVVERYALVNAAASPREYVSDAKGMFEACRDMRARGLEVLAVYHSHPTSAPVPSRTDLERNYSPDVINLIVSLKTSEPLVQGWWLSADDYRAADWRCVDEGGGRGNCASRRTGHLYVTQVRPYNCGVVPPIPPDKPPWMIICRTTPSDRSTTASS